MATAILAQVGAGRLRFGMPLLRSFGDWLCLWLGAENPWHRGYIEQAGGEVALYQPAAPSATSWQLPLVVLVAAILALVGLVCCRARRREAKPAAVGICTPPARSSRTTPPGSPEIYEDKEAYVIELAGLAHMHEARGLRGEQSERRRGVQAHDAPL